MDCYNTLGTIGEHEDDDPFDVQLPKSEGIKSLEGEGISSNKFLNLVEIKKVNIVSLENLKFFNIGDYQDDETARKITEILHEFQDCFPMKFSAIKGIVGDLGDMKIPLKPNGKPVKQ